MHLQNNLLYFTDSTGKTTIEKRKADEKYCENRGAFGARRNPGTNLEVATLLEEFRKKSADFDSRMYKQGCHF
jgi:hypothetical protein